MQSTKFLTRTLPVLQQRSRRAINTGIVCMGRKSAKIALKSTCGTANSPGHPPRIHSLVRCLTPTARCPSPEGKTDAAKAKLYGTS